jgi:Zn finger protein HypA/HybF involved in hydrogenase expression
VKAHWIYHEDDYGDYYECSHCHDEYVVYESDMEWKFCPTCGAKMSTVKPLKDTSQYADAGAMAPVT